MPHYYENPRLLVAAVALPLVAMLGWLGSLNFRETDSKTFEVKVEGFDPRDLLSGRYLRYRVHIDSPCAQQFDRKQTQCACFSERSVFVENCATRSCDYYVPGRCSGTGFQADSLEKYFFPENLQHALFTVPPNATLRVKVGAGWAKAEQMFVDGEKIEEWAKRQKRQ